MKRVIISFISVFLLQGMYAQKITLDECQEKARTNYPLIVQYQLLEKSRDYNLSNASRGYLPQFSLSAKATYQSDVTKLPIQLPETTIKPLSKDQYQVMLEVKQNIWDGGEVQSRKDITRASSRTDEEKLNVDMYALRERVNQVYFGILLLDEQLRQNKLLQEDLARSYQQISAYMDNGVANQSDLDAVQVEQLNAGQKETELLSSRRAYLKMLSILMNEDILSEVQLEKPEGDHPSFYSEVVNRPEMSWFQAQEELLYAREDALNVRHLPRFSLFVQGAYGNPGLNMLKNEFTPFYIAGVRLSWNFGSLYTQKNDKRLFDNNRKQIQSNRDLFLFNTKLQAAQETNAIQAVRELMKKDDEIIRLRENIRRAAEAKVANGILTVTDLLREITAENMAKQTKALHEIQLLINIYQLRNTWGK